MLLAIGSVALEEVNPELLKRNPADLDLIATHEAAQEFIRDHGFRYVEPVDQGRKLICKGARRGGPPVEIEIAWPGSTAEAILDYAISQGFADDTVHDPLYGAEVIIPDLDTLYTLKLSHRFLKNTPHFVKTRHDILVMERAGAKVPPALEETLQRREKETYTYAHPKLNVTKENFFQGDQVAYTYDHDSIHRAISWPEAPAYTFFMKDGAQVAVDREKFETLPHHLKLRSVLEESYVLAIERSLVPFPGVLTPRQAFEKALEKVCTSITSGWWREFAWRHYDAVLGMYSDDYATWFQYGLDFEIIQPFKESSDHAEATAEALG